MNYVLVVGVPLLILIIICASHSLYLAHRLKKFEENSEYLDYARSINDNRFAALNARIDRIVDMIADQNKIIEEHQRIIIPNKDDQLATIPDLWTIKTYNKCYRREECSCCAEQATWIFNGRPLCDRCFRMIVEVNKNSIKYINYRGVYNKEVEE